MKLRYLLPLAAMVCSGPAHAAYVIDFQQIGSDVVATGSGSLNLSALTMVLGGAYVGGGIGLGAPNAATGVGSGNFDSFSGISGPLSFGVVVGGVNYFAASANSGPLVGLSGDASRIHVPHNYISGGSLPTSTSTYQNATFASLGLTPGTYIYSWGTGANFDTFTVNIAQAAAAVPEPTTWAMILLGFAVLGLTARRDATIGTRLAWSE
ncbi:MAG: PEPxxWA-CTERM sorting domain-containing protein [Proteobacteria bacterium]|nr:PEPxxWA-CTERM sorting domain-containing protein [Pseudomonadota bacterium]